MILIWLWVKTNGTILGVGAPPILVYLSGDWDVHWGYDLGFDPWPYMDTAPIGLRNSNPLAVLQSRPFDLLVFPFWSIFRHGPKRLTF